MRHWVVPPVLALLLGLLAVAAEHYVLALNGGLPVP
jgi:hypothetical protein